MIYRRTPSLFLFFFSHNTSHTKILTMLSYNKITEKEGIDKKMYKIVMERQIQIRENAITV